MTKNARTSPWKFLSLLIAAGALTACASNQNEPDQLMTEAEARIESAEESNAGREAPVALRTARDQITSARRNIRDEDYLAARQDLEKALVNADYAIIKSRSARMQQAAEEVQRTIETLRNELGGERAS